MLERTTAWFRRAHFPADSLTSLALPGELWVSDPDHYQGSVDLRARYLALGIKRTRRGLAFELARFLLDDLLMAAGGVETSIVRLRDAIHRTETWVAEHDIRATNGIPTGVSHPTITEAWYSFADLLAWVRAVDERLDRGGRKRYGRQGLLPAIKPKRLKKRVSILVDEFRAGPAGKPTRELANFTLHAALVRSPMSGAEIDSNGVVSLPIPDPPATPITHWYILEWSAARDGIEFAELLWQAVQELVDGLLDAFERATPKRMRRSRGSEP